MPAIETHALAKDYHVGFWRPRPYRALHGLRLAVESGEVFGFLGPNGAGKTTTLKLLTYFAGLFGYKGADRTARVSRLLDEVGLGAERRLQLRKFSKGMVQRVGLAQALINDPEVIFLDEPMSGLDPLGRRDVRALIASLRENGKTIFMCSHILSDIEVLCDRVAILKKGKLAHIGRLDELRQQNGKDGSIEI